MRLKIAHRTEYRYDTPPEYGLQRIRLTPQDGDRQRVLSWRIAISGAREEVRYVDGFGNETRLLSLDGGPHELAIEAAGEVETEDTAGIAGAHSGFAPLWLFCGETELTAPGPMLRELSREIGAGDELERLHALMKSVAGRVDYVPGATAPSTTAEEALALGAGVCQDHAHAFISAARLLGFPARYVSGYLMRYDKVEQAASHAWAEAHVSGLGWVGFDPANGVSPDEAYVTLAVGRDYRDAAPISGIRVGRTAETLAVRVTVEQ